MAISFETQRLKVSEVTENLSDVDRLPLLSEIPRILTPSVVESLPPYFHGIDSEVLADGWLSRMLSESRLLLVTSAGDELIGFLFVYVENDNDAHIGYLLAEKFWGKGLASELLRGFIDVVSEKEVWLKLIGGVNPTNIVSAKVLKKLGFIEQVGDATDVVFFEYSISRAN